MANHDEEFKRTIAEEYLTGTSGYKVLAPKFGVSRITIKGWVNFYRYHGDGDGSLRKRVRHYSARFKLSVLNKMWQQGLSYTRLAALFDLRARTKSVRQS